ncbi:MAG: DNA (cytosine-5-)-methyltransferase [Phototrophicaceae bacterium]
MTNLNQLDQCKHIANHRTRKVGTQVLSRIKALEIGQKMQDLPEELWHESFRYYVREDPNRKGGPNLRMIRLDPNKPSLTVTGYIYNKFVHPFEDRFITPREAARLQGFPDDLEFKGSLTSVQRQIGDAVPIELGEALFKGINHFVRNHLPAHLLSLNAISLFSGAGGLDIAMNRASESSGVQWNTAACVEVDIDRCKTLRGYFGDHQLILNEDIRSLHAQDILSAAQLNKEDITLIFGGPPCQSFSQAGKQKGKHDPRGELIFEFLRFISEIRPPLFLLENVSNLKGIDKGNLFHTILEEVYGLGYQVDYGIMNSAEFGNAQKRRRLLILGTHQSLSHIAQLPLPSHSETPDLFGTPRFKTVADALEGLPRLAE